MPASGLSPAGVALGDYGGGLLAQQRDQETEEIRKRRMAAQKNGVSPAGVAVIDYGMMSVPGAVA